MLTKNFNFKNPDYSKVFQDRIDYLARIRKDPACIPALKVYYKEHPADFISDFGTTSDPRNVELGLPVTIPFILFPRQEDLVQWLLEKWHNREPGLIEKSRDVGITWLVMSLACTLCLFHRGMAIGAGSRKEEYVDKIGDPKTLFHKARAFMRNLPKEFRGGWVEDKHSPYMRCLFPETEATLTGEAGDNIGRGDRTGIYFVDEAAHVERPMLIEASLSQTTNCRIDLSSVNGRANVFAGKRYSGRVDVFVFDWRDDPRKDDAWYAKQKARLDPITLAQEVDRDYSAAVEGVVIPQQWVLASFDAHIKLGIVPTGAKGGALDVADQGVDKNAFCGAHGILVEYVEEWSGKGADIFATVQKSFSLCDELGYDHFKYDADGLGAGVRGDARIINESRTVRKIKVDAFRGSEAVFSPDGEDVKGRKNKDMFANRKAQGWWSLRTRFQKTYRWVVEGVPCDPDEIISIAASVRDRQQLAFEISQPTASTNAAGKTLIDKTPDGTKSPNRADALMIAYASIQKSMVISDRMLVRSLHALPRSTGGISNAMLERSRGR